MLQPVPIVVTGGYQTCQRQTRISLPTLYMPYQRGLLVRSAAEMNGAVVS